MGGRCRWRRHRLRRLRAPLQFVGCRDRHRVSGQHLDTGISVRLVGRSHAGRRIRGGVDQLPRRRHLSRRLRPALRWLRGADRHRVSGRVRAGDRRGRAARRCRSERQLRRRLVGGEPGERADRCLLPPLRRQRDGAEQRGARRQPCLRELAAAGGQCGAGRTLRRDLATRFRRWRRRGRLRPALRGDLRLADAHVDRHRTDPDAHLDAHQ